MDTHYTTAEHYQREKKLKSETCETIPRKIRAVLLHALRGFTGLIGVVATTFWLSNPALADSSGEPLPVCDNSGQLVAIDDLAFVCLPQGWGVTDDQSATSPPPSQGNAVMPGVKAVASHATGFSRKDDQGATIAQGELFHARILSDGIFGVAWGNPKGAIQTTHNSIIKKILNVPADAADTLPKVDALNQDKFVLDNILNPSPGISSKPKVRWGRINDLDFLSSQFSYVINNINCIFNIRNTVADGDSFHLILISDEQHASSLANEIRYIENSLNIRAKISFISKARTYISQHAELINMMIGAVLIALALRRRNKKKSEQLGLTRF